MRDFIRIVIGLLLAVLLLKSSYLLIRIIGAWLLVMTGWNLYYFTKKQKL